MSTKQRLDPSHVRHNVGECPACRTYLWADVELTTTVSDASMSRDGKPIATASVKATGMNLHHVCAMRVPEDD